MKKLTTLTFALALTVTVAHAQHVINLDQKDASTADIQQIGGAIGSEVTGTTGAFTQEGGSDLYVRQLRNPYGDPSGQYDVRGEQLGSANYIGVRQNNGGSQEATIQQQGSTNSAVLWQEYGDWGTSNEASITQTGNNNKVEGLYNNANVVSETALSHVTVDGKWAAYQNGTDNELAVTQSGNGNALFVAQLDDESTVNLSQQGGALAEIRQEGGNNLVAGDAAGLTALQSNNSDLFVQQQGGNNVVVGSQTAVGSTATIFQTNGSQTTFVQQ